MQYVISDGMVSHRYSEKFRNQSQWCKVTEFVLISVFFDTDSMVNLLASGCTHRTQSHKNTEILKQEV